MTSSATQDKVLDDLFGIESSDDKVKTNQAIPSSGTSGGGGGDDDFDPRAEEAPNLDINEDLNKLTIQNNSSQNAR